ncbi:MULTISPECIES: helix-turn-helix transcriptional regulator [Moraxella]|uniref:Transcriptional regulator n=1 Tax=Moraxella lacunata TaxID=477 RepID=A0A1B8Q5S9_MORLA|nr:MULTISPECIES: helix-turn-helix transcriptional regulator [Moraxella]MBE9577709.1 helix-turn-helix transcriptional regulator [Moraxella sp. K1664]MBE9587034.1 helix-turn-helix transcriptional regulator [Moraxella sp. K1630]MBE9595272.1 helix-turn-helix transcriptional regulator [Moraxella sp. K2450]MDH9217756.1 helix-turn-helix transcriptional regulator [Moraxella lacunata]MDI4481725.1 XRE family transcriptional regulator [Moraxella lacunata]
MIDFDTIRELREERHWTQEQMAEKLGLTRNGYAKIETGKSTPSLERLDEIASLFGVKFELLKLDSKSVVYQIGENYHGNNNYYNNNEKLQEQIHQLHNDIEKLRLIIAHKDELLNQKDEYIKILKHLAKADDELPEL